MLENVFELENDKLSKLGLIPEKIHRHQDRILHALNHSIKTEIPIDCEASVQNGGIISHEIAEAFIKNKDPRPEITKSVVSLIPAAGAASRFFSELHKFILDVEKQAINLKALRTHFNQNKSVQPQLHYLLQNVTIPISLSKLFGYTLSENFNAIPNVIFEKTKDFFSFAAIHLANSRWEDKNPLQIRHEWDLFSQKNAQTNVESVIAYLVPDQNDSQAISLILYCLSVSLVDTYAELPKAFVEANNEKDDFLKLKLIEQLELFPSLSNHFIGPVGWSDKFIDTIKKTLSPSAIVKSSYENLFGVTFASLDENTRETFHYSWNVLEQGKELSTIRFQLDGSPYIEKNGDYSPVAAGHGELLNLFDKIADNDPSKICLHIRNIDNVIGTHKNQQKDIFIPSSVFFRLHDILQTFRLELREIQNGSSASLSSKATSFLLELMALTKQSVDKNSITESSESLLKILLHTFSKLFHWEPLQENLSLNQRYTLLIEKLHLPLSVMGVVSKEENDVGGGPVFAKTLDGAVVKLCMEMPHANENDVKKYFGKNGKVTHFNPVLVFFELRAGKPDENGILPKVNFRQLFDERFWLLTKREVQGKPVCYHETVLYELIGNSAMTNLLFVEVPRSLFRPHKSFLDVIGNRRETYGFDETIKLLEEKNIFTRRT